MKKNAALVTAAAALALGACQIDPAGTIIERQKTPDTSHWENVCETVNGKRTCTAKWDSEPARCDVHVKIDDGGKMWREFDCADWDLYAPGSRYPKDAK